MWWMHPIRLLMNRWKQCRNRFSNVVSLSALTGEGLGDLTDRIVSMLGQFWERIQLSIPAEEQSLISLLHDQGKIFRKDYIDNHVEFDVEIPRKLAEKFRR